jgi:hypothetical protein
MENKEKIYKQQKEYRKANPEKMKEKRRRNYTRNQGAKIEKSLEYYYENKESILEKNKIKNKEAKIQAFKVVCNTEEVKCEICGNAEMVHLTIDHSENNGVEHRKKFGKGDAIYRAIVRGKIPEDELKSLRILCWNHNCSRARKCSKENEELKLKAYSIISLELKCAICGDSELNHLTIDHINGGGKEHRKRYGTTGFYQAIIRGKLSKEELENLRILCWNHNCSRNVKD